MQILEASFLASLTAARDDGIAPVWFAHFEGRNRDTGVIEPLGIWSGDDDLTLAVEAPSGGTMSQTYIGGCNLSVEGITSVLGLTDNEVTISMSQIAGAAQQILRGYDVRLATVTIHATTLTGGRLTSVPQLMFVGTVDEGDVATPAAGSEGAISITARDEIISMLKMSSPAKSSDEHQKRRNLDDRFGEYASTVSDRKIQWYHKKQ